MKRIIGITIGLSYAVLAWLAYTSAVQNWFLGNSDLGLWWAVIGTLLGVAGLGAFFGTVIHTRPAED
jgi:hypothetical protein